jgi:hypothetical protein
MREFATTSGVEIVVKVHVWLPNETHVGHAALTVGDAKELESR